MPYEAYSMKKSIFAIAGIVSALTLSYLLACPGGMGKGHGMGMMKGKNCMGRMSMLRHRFVMRNGIPAAYQAKRNPYQANLERVQKQGKELFAQNCAVCHGKTGLGDGPAGQALTPKATNIARFSKMPMASDAYLFWTISEGGKPVGSAMPAFKGQLKPDQIWQIISYLRKI